MFISHAGEPIGVNPDHVAMVQRAQRKDPNADDGTLIIMRLTINVVNTLQVHVRDPITDVIPALNGQSLPQVAAPATPGVRRKK
jgi:hypothetical protein